MIVGSSVKDSHGDPKLISTTEPITFKFSKPMSKVNVVPSTGNSTGIKDFDEKNVILTLSTDKKTATFTPNDGNWTLAANVTSGKIKITGEATDGATNILNNTFEVFFNVDN